MDIQKIKVKIAGIADIMFDRFIDHSKEVRPPEQKLYLKGKNEVVLPAENIVAFLFGDDPGGCAKVFEKKGCRDYLRAGLSHVFIDPVTLPLMKNKKKVIFKDFETEAFWIHKGSPRTKQGSRSIKQEEKQRPVLTMPWELAFDINLVKNPMIDSTKLFNWFTRGGIFIGLGTFRPRFGRFEVTKWED